MEKASLVQSALRRRPWHEAGYAVEYGAFVGYTSVRLASRLSDEAGPRSFSLEVDPVHQALATRLLDLCGLLRWGEVWGGQVRDVLPRLAEELGARCCALAFADHRGTRFHEDFAGLARVGAPAVVMQAVADNVLNPGGPVFAWGLRFMPYATAWSLPEFLSPDKEDWMAVLDAPPAGAL